MVNRERQKTRDLLEKYGQKVMEDDTLTMALKEYIEKHQELYAKILEETCGKYDDIEIEISLDYSFSYSEVDERWAQKDYYGVRDETDVEMKERIAREIKREAQDKEQEVKDLAKKEKQRIITEEKEKEMLKQLQEKYKKELK